MVNPNFGRDRSYRVEIPTSLGLELVITASYVESDVKFGFLAKFWVVQAVEGGGRVCFWARLWLGLSFRVVQMARNPGTCRSSTHIYANIPVPTVYEPLRRFRI